MDLQVTIQTTHLGFDYDIELHSWHQKLCAYRVFNNTERKELLEGG